MEWTKDIVTEFIELYREKPCLWKIKDNAYVNNKNMKREAYDELVNFLKTKNFTVTVMEVKRKIQNLRNAFRKESKKIEDSLRSGSGTEDIYSPTLWYYDLLLFTKDQDTPLPSLDNLNYQSLETDTESQEEVEDINDDTIINLEGENSQVGKKQDFKQPLFKQNKRTKKERDPNLTNFIKACTTTLSTPDASDEYDAMCTSFAAKLRKMETKQQIFAESLMHRVITLGLLNNLNEHVDIVNVRQFKPQTLNTFQKWQPVESDVLSQMSSSNDILSSASTSNSNTVFSSVTDYYNSANTNVDFP